MKHYQDGNLRMMVFSAMAYSDRCCRQSVTVSFDIVIKVPKTCTKKVALKKILNHILYQWSCFRPSVRSQNSLPFLKNSRPSFVLIRLDFGIALASLHTINLVQSFQELCHLPCESQSNGFPLSELTHHLLITWHKIYKKYFQAPCPFKILFSEVIP